MTSTRLWQRLGTLGLAALPFLLAPGSALAGGGGGSGGSGGVNGYNPENTSVGSDDVESIPLVANPWPSGPFGPAGSGGQWRSHERLGGFEIEVPAWRAGSLLRSVQGRGEIRMRTTRSGNVALSFEGRFAIPLDRSELARRQLRIRFQGDRSGLQVVQRGRRMILLQR
jgi:hypothetical protein